MVREKDKVRVKKELHKSSITSDDRLRIFANLIVDRILEDQKSENSKATNSKNK